MNEEATKTALVLPFFSILGYNIFNPKEFVPEYIADVGIKKGERVDYAIIKDGKPAVIIEAKQIGTDLNEHKAQLFRYFATTQCEIAILTDGVKYWFFTDTEVQNIMDLEPYFMVDLAKCSKDDLTDLMCYKKGAKYKNYVRYTQNPVEAYRKACSKLLYNVLTGQNINDFVNICLRKAYVDIEYSEAMDITRELIEIGVETIKNSNYGVPNIEDMFGYSDYELGEDEIDEQFIKDLKDKMLAQNNKNATAVERKVKVTGIDSINNSVVDRSKEYVIGTAPTKGLKISYARIFGTIHNDISYVTIMDELLSEIHRRDRKLIEDNILSNSKLNNPENSVSYVSMDPSRSKKPRNVRGTELYIDTYIGSEEVVRRILMILDCCGIPHSAISVKFK
jgi:hypothetical protein